MTRSPEEIREWLRAHLAAQLSRDPADIDPTASLDRYGVDSLAAADLTGALADWLQTEVSPTLPYEFPTIVELAQHLASTEAT